MGFVVDGVGMTLYRVVSAGGDGEFVIADVPGVHSLEFDRLEDAREVMRHLAGAIRAGEVGVGECRKVGVVKQTWDLLESEEV